MINYVYQLVSPEVFSVKYNDITFNDKVIVRPAYMAVCHADQRYYQGKRDRKVLRNKLPMALIHECCAEVVFDPTGEFFRGQSVVLIPNVPGEKKDYIYENYAKGSAFLSSGRDGFLQEYVELESDRVVSAEGIPGNIAAISEFVSVAVHAVRRFSVIAHEEKRTIGIWGNGSLGFVLACVLKKVYPDSHIVVIGRNERKLAYFSFVDETFKPEELPEDFRADHAFECCGGEGSYSAIEDIIRVINPQGTVMLMGVSENRVPINTRNILEKGLTFVGSSRSGRADFEETARLMQDEALQNRLRLIMYDDAPVTSIDDLHRVFRNDMNTPFKTVFKWDV